MQRILDTTAGIFLDYPKTEGDLEELIRECLSEDLSQHDDIKRIRLEFVSRNSLARLPFHEIDLRRAVTNLILNAAQASRDGDLVRVEVWQEGNQANLTVTDQGPGIKEGIGHKIFETHFTRNPRGYGLGLAACKEIIEDFHGGDLSFCSDPENGTTFHCRLPMV